MYTKIVGDVHRKGGAMDMASRCDVREVEAKRVSNTQCIGNLAATKTSKGNQHKFKWQLVKRQPPPKIETNLRKCEPARVKIEHDQRLRE
jgi:hypothetical protein